VSLANLGLVMAVWLVMSVFSERWWLTAPLVYMPRSPLLFGCVALLAAGCLWNRKAIYVNLASLALVAVPVMGLQINPRSLRQERSHGEYLRVASCNVKQYEPAFDIVVAELADTLPDLVVLQEASGQHPLLDGKFGEAEWYVSQFSEYFAASKFPIRRIASCQSEAFDRTAAVAYEIDHQFGRFRLFQVHLQNAREGLSRMSLATIFSSDKRRFQREFAAGRRSEAAAVRKFIEEHRAGLPVLVMGDFGVPSDSSLYSAIWSDLENAFDVAGFGYGYTAPCESTGHWPVGVPWVRVDHVLTCDQFHVERCWTGIGNGSDHRLIAAVVSPWRNRARSTERRR
jgi:endonuclease/exonuclease/phosphatase family metal-dependent hydrolase